MMPPRKKVILKDMRPYILGGGKKKKKGYLKLHT